MIVTQKPKKTAPQRLVFTPPKRRKVWIGVAVVGAVLALAIGLLVTSGGNDEPASAIEVGSGGESAVESPIQLPDTEVLPYEPSVAVWEAFLAKQQAAELPYRSSIEVQEEFLAKRQAEELPYAGSVALWNEFLAKQEAAAGIAD